QESVRLGAAQVEFDVRRTKDNRLIIMHDETVDRTTNGTGILITLENSFFKTIFIVNHVLKVPIVPKVPLITKTEF
ncbi:MAG: hypothetical protein LBC02_12645, partial [Planctomycetaceae bacterium]|nr:hypothetical protein [Planctomycetaceae bacterium]